MMRAFLCVCAIVSDSVTLWTVAHHAPLSMEYSRQEYQSELPFPPPGYLPNPGIEPTDLVSPALAGRFYTIAPPPKERASFTVMIFFSKIP